MNRKRFLKSLVRAAAAICGVAMTATGVSAAFVTVWGGPTYDQTTQTGYQHPYVTDDCGSPAADGTAVCYVDKLVGGTFLGDRAVRWDATGSAAIEMGNLGTNNTGFTFTQA